MKTKDKFTETKIKMVMKLKKIDYQSAVEEIARIDAVRRKSQEDEAAKQEATRERHANLVARRRHEMFNLI